MFALSRETIHSVLASALDWCRDKAKSSRGSDLGYCSDFDLEQVAKDIRMSVSELRSVAKRGPQAADLLLRRMTELDLDPKEVSLIEPETFRDMQRLCTLCRYHKRCARDFARGAATKTWNDYCSNSGTLAALNSLPWSARREWR
jgi:hypothetical protein